MKTFLAAVLIPPVDIASTFKNADAICSIDHVFEGTCVCE